MPGESLASPPSDSLANAQQRLTEARGNLRTQLAVVRRLRWASRWARFHLVWLDWATTLRQLVDRTVRWRLGAGLCIAVAQGGLTWIITDSPLLAAAVAIAVGVILMALLSNPPDQVLETARKLAGFERDEAAARLAVAHAEVPGLQATLRGVLLEHAEIRVEAARLELSRNADRRLAVLANSRWRLLRATEWEHFLKLVFTELGYQVELTGMSGDQGVDLVLKRGGRKIAVQAKGYAGNVPNSSVQQAYAGQGFYECHACAVVTNSRFTDSAQELAAKLGCVLIDEQRLVRMMNHQLDFWKLCFGDTAPEPTAT